MNRFLIFTLFGAATLAASAQSFTEWKNPEVNAVNRSPMRAQNFAYRNGETALIGMDRKASSNYLSLNGIWKFNWVNDASARPVDFWKRISTTAAGARCPFPEYGR